VQERNADLFASSLLMPREGVLMLIPKQEISMRKISLPTILKLEQYFSVSRTSMLYRLNDLELMSKQQVEDYKYYSPKETAKQYGYDTALYEPGNENLIIGDYGVKARELFEREIISEGEYMEAMNLIRYEEE
jgi:Zn-dependent peptidase ImmA (M78 family)